MSKFQHQAGFPTTRLRRLRRTPALREMFRESTLNVADFIYPLFVVEGENVRNEISSMPDQYQLSVDQAVRECEELQRLGIKSIILFGIPNEKDEAGSGAYADDGIIQKAIRAIKKEFTDLVVITDVCL